jgi:hypothetical protein
MEGDGVDLRGRRVHIAELGSTGWVNAAGRPTVPVCLGKWTDGPPVWLIGGWRNRHGAVTFPLTSGGWSNGPGERRLPYGGVTFAPQPSLPLRYYHSIAVDPRLIPLGSRVYVPLTATSAAAGSSPRTPAERSKADTSTSTAPRPRARTT